MWESRLVESARRTGAVRLVGRIYEPEDLLRMGSVDAIVVGAETSWISPALIRTWRSAGRRIVGLHDPSDTPAQRLLEEGGADVVAPDTTPPEDLLRTLVAWGDTPLAPEGASIVTAVTGARGAPGRTTIAVALARILGRGTLLLDADPLPNIGPALGIGPGPELETIVSTLRNDTGFVGLAHPEDGLAVLCPESSGDPLAGALVCELAFGARSEFGHIVLETGPPSAFLTRMQRGADRIVLVVDGTPQGIIRAGALVRDWEGVIPTVVLNRTRGDVEDAVRSCRAALGLEPTVLLPHLPGDPVRSAMPFLEGLL